jgi:hypothetical protein
MAYIPYQKHPTERQSSSGEPVDAAIYTRYCAAPQPRERYEPRYIHALMLAAWLGRLLDPIDLAHQGLPDRQSAARRN